VVHASAAQTKALPHIGLCLFRYGFQATLSPKESNLEVARAENEGWVAWVLEKRHWDSE